MKALYLLQARLRQYYIKNKLIFCLFFVGCLLSSLAYIYIFANCSQYYIQRDSDSMQYRCYQFSTTDKAKPLSMEKVQKLVESEDISSVVAYVPMNPESPDGSKLLGAAIKGAPVYLNHKEGTADIVKLKNDEIIVAKGLGYSENGTMTVYGSRFRTVGQIWQDDISYITAEAFLEITSSPIQIECQSATWDTSEAAPAYLLIQELFSEDGIQWLSSPQNYKGWDMTISRPEQIKAIISYLASAVAFLFLFRYMLDSLAEDTLICRICGASRIEMSVMTFWEAIILTTLPSLLAVFVHKLLTPSFFSKINIVRTITYYPSDYALILLILFCINVIAVIPFLRRYQLNSIHQARKNIS